MNDLEKILILTKKIIFYKITKLSKNNVNLDCSQIFKKTQIEINEH